MALVNHEKREVVFKVVYGGSATSGKTTNLALLCSQIEPSRRSELAMQATSTDRTIAVDLFAADTVIREGYRTRFQIYTVPGEVSYDATRQLVMRGADGLVFVIDSRPEAMEENWRVFQSLLESVTDSGASLDELAIVLQYNKRDAANAVSVEYLESIFNRREGRFPSFEAVACRGENVLATLNAVSRLILHRFHEAIGDAPAGGVAPAREEPEVDPGPGPGHAGEANFEAGDNRWDYPDSGERPAAGAAFGQSERIAGRAG